MTEERVEWHLWNWARWMDKGTGRGENYPNEACGGMECYTSNTVTDEAYERQCDTWAWATDSVIDGLESPYKTAIYAQLLRGIWALPELVRGPYFRAAVELVGRGLAKKGIE